MLALFSRSSARRAVFAACAAVAALASAGFMCPSLGLDRGVASALSVVSWLVGALAISALLEDLLHHHVLPVAWRGPRKLALRLS